MAYMGPYWPKSTITTKKSRSNSDLESIAPWRNGTQNVRLKHHGPRWTIILLRDGLTFASLWIAGQKKRIEEIAKLQVKYYPCRNNNECPKNELPYRSVSFNHCGSFLIFERTMSHMTPQKRTPIKNNGCSATIKNAVYGSVPPIPLTVSTNLWAK